MTKHLIYFSLIYLSVDDGEAMRQYITTVMDPADYRTSCASCVAQGGSLPMIFAFTNGLPASDIWLPVRREQQAAWRYVDGSELNSSTQKRHFPVKLGYDCMIVRTMDEFVDIEDCNAGNGFICPRKDASTCPNNAECYQIKTWNIAVYRTNVNWYQAQRYCQGLGSDLITFKGEDLDQISSQLHRILPKDGHFYIGLRKNYWIMESSSLKADVQMYNWDKDEPSGTGDCVVMSTVTTLWKAVRCSSKHHYVCQCKVTSNNNTINVSKKNAVSTAEQLISTTPKPFHYEDTHINTDSSRVCSNNFHVLVLLASIHILLFGACMCYHIIKCVCCSSQSKDQNKSCCFGGCGKECSKTEIPVRDDVENGLSDHQERLFNQGES